MHRTQPLHATYWYGYFLFGSCYKQNLHLCRPLYLLEKTFLFRAQTISSLIQPYKVRIILFPFNRGRHQEFQGETESFSNRGKDKNLALSLIPRPPLTFVLHTGHVKQMYHQLRHYSGGKRRESTGRGTTWKCPLLG